MMRITLLWYEELFNEGIRITDEKWNHQGKTSTTTKY